jgi:hypothetical protein
MKIFLLDLWHDLREKRLAPVAVVLLAGLVAVPVLLAKPAEDPGPAAVAPATVDKSDREAMAALTKVKLGEDATGKGSTLGVFDPDNPFHPPKGAIKKDEPVGGATGPGSGASPGDGVGSAGGGAPSDGGSIGGGGLTPGAPGVPAPGTPGTPDGGKTTTTLYKYVVDLTFSANGRTRKIKGMEKLDMLPSDSSPLLIFMGVTAKGGDAVFLVDSTLEAAGEGRCKPSESECAFAYIGPGAEYVFTEEDGDTYTVKIDEIRKVEVDASGSRAKGAKGATARASVGEPRRFVPPVLADLVVVASDRLENSNNDPKSR